MPSGPTRRVRTTATTATPDCGLLTLTKRPASRSRVVKTDAPMRLIFSVTRALAFRETSMLSKYFDCDFDRDMMPSLFSLLRDVNFGKHVVGFFLNRPKTGGRADAISYRWAGSLAKVRGGCLPTNATPSSTSAPRSVLGFEHLDVCH
jgi:hypothetical protein